MFNRASCLTSQTLWLWFLFVCSIVVCSIVEIGALTRYALLHSVYVLKAAQMTVPRSLIRKLRLYEFKLGHNVAEATKNIFVQKRGRGSWSHYGNKIVEAILFWLQESQRSGKVRLPEQRGFRGRAASHRGKSVVEVGITFGSTLTRSGSILFNVLFKVQIDLFKNYSYSIGPSATPPKNPK